MEPSCRLKDLTQREEKQKNTVRAVFDSWKTAELQNRKDKGKEIERAFEKDVFPLIGRKPIGEITRNDMKAILDRVLKRKAQSMGKPAFVQPEAILRLCG
ncbi:hypothetical protein DYBT9275_04907 [Dyadobacter sp. CECT 9275]|uniref:Phage integrase central domain-containing protein n=1 Tax=Dyadobacter helix TaxID=2822344 RepID=A0A916JHJ9_9BACT|nr:hypothetical protein [Dyadobacter sp. CECT 9275]CAG5011221.1 hypothetical protein DYBT9275_04907 [Dyadobacter sp. CECT 9275]